jgi:hypothetical protein
MNEQNLHKRKHLITWSVDVRVEGDAEAVNQVLPAGPILLSLVIGRIGQETKRTSDQVKNLRGVLIVGSGVGSHGEENYWRILGGRVKGNNLDVAIVGLYGIRLPLKNAGIDGSKLDLLNANLGDKHSLKLGNLILDVIFE